MVIVSLVGAGALQRLLEVLRGPDGLPSGSELLVVGGVRPPEAGAAWIQAPPGWSVPRRRVLGIRESRGPIVALLEDTTLPEPGWARAVCELHRLHPEAGAIGGTLRLDSGLAPRAAALTLLEYGSYLRDGPVSEVSTSLPGNNLSFKREALKRSATLGEGVLREAELIPALARRPGAVRLEAGMRATCIAVDPKGARDATRFHHGRLYAGHRFRASQRLRRGLRALWSPALPLVLLMRCLPALRRQRVAHPARVLGHALRMSLAWSIGEGVGYVCGPGDAEKAWT